MADFINTIAVLGDDAVIDSIIERTITEFKDDTVSTIGQSAFNGCANLTEVCLLNADSVGDSSLRRTGISEVTDQNFPKLKSITGNYAFGGCESLVYFQSSAWETQPSASRVFDGSGNLKTVDVSALQEIRHNQFLNCGSLAVLILRKSDAIVTLSATNVFDNTPIKAGTGYIYVPRALLDTYKAATNWSTFGSSIFRALEDYTVDGTITGALDETKI